MSAAFDIKKLQIMLYTNDQQNPEMELKGSMFDDVKGDYPLFSYSVLYVADVLDELFKDDHSQKIQTFFNLNMFQIFLEQCEKRQPSTAGVKIEGCNIKTMLNVLFKISYPVPSSVKLEIDEYKCPNSTGDQSLISIGKSFFDENIYTHLSSKSKKYTVIDVKWPNTIQSNPDYQMGINKSLAIYNTERAKFVSTNTDKIASLTKKITDDYVLENNLNIFDEDKLFIKYDENTGQSTISKKIKDMIEKIEALQQDFIFYTYIWILYILSINGIKYNNKSFVGTRSTESIYNLDLNTILEKTINEINTPINSGGAGKKTPISAPISAKVVLKKNKLAEAEDIVIPPKAAIQPKAKATIPTTLDFIPNNMNLLSTNRHIKELIFPAVIENNIGITTKTCNITETLRSNLIDELLKEKYNLIKYNNYINFKKFVKFVREFDNIQNKGFTNDSIRKSMITYINSDNAQNNDENVLTPAIIAVFSIFSTKQHIVMANALCEYGFGEKGLYPQIMALHKTIKTLSEFKIDKISNSDDVKTQIEEIKKIPTEILDTKDLMKKLEEIQTKYELIEASSIIESSSQTKRTDAWNELYRNQRWYRNFSEKIRDITQSRKSTNPQINEAIQEKQSVNLKELTDLIEGKVQIEAGLDEINIRSSSRENLPAYKINLFCILVGGEITEANRGLITCPYKANKLGDLFENLWLDKLTVFLRTKFFDLTNSIKQAEAKAKQAEAKNNKTRKNKPKDDGINDLVERAGLNEYSDRDLMPEKLGQGFVMPDFLRQGLIRHGNDNDRKKNNNNKISGDLEQFIETHFKSINTDESKNISKRINHDIFTRPSEFIDYLKSDIDSSIIKALEEIVTQEDKFNDLKTFEKNQSTITTMKGKFTTEYELLNNKSKLILDNDKEKHYLKMYHIKLMENLLTIIGNLLKTKTPEVIERSDSPRGRGGSRKRVFKIPLRKTQRKSSHT